MTKNASLNIQQIINYQEDSIVSKEIVKSDGGSITLFAFDQGQELTEHTAPYEALVMIAEGEAEISVSGVWHKVTQGEVLKIPSNASHAVNASKPFKMMLVMIK